MHPMYNTTYPPSYHHNNFMETQDRQSMILPLCDTSLQVAMMLLW